METKEVPLMCRSIERLFNVEPPVTEGEIRAAALQFVRKISGVDKPSKANGATFLAAVDTITDASSRLLTSLQTNAPPLQRADRAAKARARAAQRFPTERVTRDA
jgi:hypothetical protein